MHKHGGPRKPQGTRGLCLHAGNALTTRAGAVGTEDLWQAEREQCGCELAQLCGHCAMGKIFQISPLSIEESSQIS